MTRLLITGAGGFLGQAMVSAALAHPQISAVIASDVQSITRRHPKLSVLTCSLADPRLHHAAKQADAVIHLAGILGKAAEDDPDLAEAVNVTASLDLMAACCRETRFVFASSIAVLGETRDQRAPVMIYGAHKARVEIALEEASAQGRIDAISLRPGGIVARPRQATTLKSAFLSDMFWAVRDGVDMIVPVSATATTALASVRVVAEQFLKTCLIPDLGAQRSLTLPMLRVTFGDLLAALHAAFPDSPSQVTFAPDATMMRLFGQAPDYDFHAADKLGLCPDRDVATLITNALQIEDIR